MLRVRAALAAGVIAALLLAGCGGGDSDPGDDPVVRTPTTLSGPPPTDY
jgi:hypothetical protein